MTKFGSFPLQSHLLADGDQRVLVRAHGKLIRSIYSLLILLHAQACSHAGRALMQYFYLLTLFSFCFHFYRVREIKFPFKELQDLIDEADKGIS